VEDCPTGLPLTSSYVVELGHSKLLKDVFTFLIDYGRQQIVAAYRGILHQVKQRAGDRRITAEDMEKSQHTDFNEETTNESASVACSNIRL